MSAENPLTDHELSLLEKGFKLKEYSIERNLDDIPNAGPCPLCGDPTRKSIISYSVVSHDSVVINPDTPGYSCDSNKCGAQLMDLETTRQLRVAAAAILDPDKDSHLRSILLRDSLPNS